MHPLINLKNSFFAPDYQSGRRLISIDGLRGLLILHVMLHHFMLFFGQAYSLIPFQHFAETGYLAVRFFFAVSGFLLFQQMEKRSQVDAKPYFYFYLRRIFRIYPVWLLIVCIVWYFSHLDYSTVLLNLTFAFGFFSYDIKNIPIGPAWSLFVEEWFYLAFPIVYLFAKRIRYTVGLLAVTSFISWYWLKYASSFDVPSSNYFIELFPLAHLHFFVLGILVYQINQWPFWQKILKLPRSRWVLELGSLISLLGLLSGYAIANTALCIFLAFIALGHHKTFFTRICSLKIFRIFGVSCYPLYLFHMPILAWLSKPVRIFMLSHELLVVSNEVIAVVGFSLFCILCLGLCLTVRVMIEVPFIKLGNRLVLKMQQAIS